MKIVYIATSIIPSRTANSIHVMKMCQAFAQNGHEVTLIVPDWKEGVEQEVDDVYEYYGVEECFEIRYLLKLPTQMGRILYSWLAAREAKLIDPDVIYGRDIMACYFVSKYDILVFFESHAPVRDAGRVSDYIFHRLLQSASFEKLIVITHTLKKYYLETYSLLSEKVLVSPDGADPISGNVTPIIFPNQGTKLQVGYVGHLYSGRGIDLIETLAEMCSWADFHIVGGTHKDILICKERTCRLDNIFFHGFVPPAEAERYCIGCDVLIAPYQESVAVSGNVGNTVKWMSPLKVFEYMAAGKAIIASDLPVLREIIRDSETGIFCSPQNVDSWSESLKFLKDHEGIRIQIGENARKIFLQEFTWHSRAKKIIEVITPR